MTTTYMIHAWCMRPFIATIDIEADTPDEAINKARMERQWLFDTAEECNGKYPWDEFAAYDEDGNELLLVCDSGACLRDAAPVLLEMLVYVRSMLKLRHIGEASDEAVNEALAMAAKVIAQTQPASPLPKL